jgi:transcriptional regulator with XRE-family HTH domain
VTAAELRKARARLGMTQGEMAKALRVSLTTVGRYENGSRRITRVFEFAVSHLETLKAGRR